MSGTDPFKLSHLDVENLRAFRQNTESGVQWFINEIKTLINSPADPAGGQDPIDGMAILGGDGGPAGKPVLNPLQLGRLGAPKEGDKVSAGRLPEVHKGAAGELARIEIQQQILFDRISLNLQATIAEMESAQDSSLAEVEAGKFLDAWASVDRGLVPPKSV
ncbi:type VII secretion system-associated protein [Streptomyces clavuligerus]|nr:type VII secretion system-associated protein [Streptomyces clavuligerus]WDN56301.1 type VII secretion system-associated protein [Streptomyces clavuligerus]